MKQRVEDGAREKKEDGGAEILTFKVHVVESRVF
jgi:hypothetical protein